MIVAGPPPGPTEPVSAASPDYSPARCRGSGDAGEQGPERSAGVVGTEVQAQVGTVAVSDFADPAADFDEAQAEGIELQPGGLGGEQPAAELVEQPVGGGVQQQAEGIGPEAV